VIRQHWGIENKLHWVLDVGFGEDLDRKRAGHAAQNFSVLNRIALNLLKQDKSSKRGIKGKRLKAAWNHPYLLKLIGIWYASALPSRLMALAVRGNCAMDPRGSASVEGVLSQPDASARAPGLTGTPAGGDAGPVTDQARTVQGTGHFGSSARVGLELDIFIDAGSLSRLCCAVAGFEQVCLGLSTSQQSGDDCTACVIPQVKLAAALAKSPVLSSRSIVDPLKDSAPRLKTKSTSASNSSWAS